MAALSPSEDQLRLQVREVITADPGIPFGHALQRWKARSSLPADEVMVSRLYSLYLEEQAAALAGRSENAHARRGEDGKGIGAIGGWVVLEFLIGVPIAFLGLATILGSFSTAALALGFAVICTAGVSLIVILPLCWLVGLVVVSLARWIFRFGRGT